MFVQCLIALQVIITYPKPCTPRGKRHNSFDGSNIIDEDVVLLVVVMENRRLVCGWIVLDLSFLIKKSSSEGLKVSPSKVTADYP